MTASWDELTEDYFLSWEGTYAGKFLVRDQASGHLKVDRVYLIDHARTLSGGEQVYCAIWWELDRGTQAPWTESSALARITVLDLDHQGNAVTLLRGRYALNLEATAFHEQKYNRPSFRNPER